MIEFLPFLVLVVLVMGLRVANQYQRGVVFRLGKLQGLRGPGLYWLIPILEWQRLVDLRTITASVDQQETITKDNVPVKVTAVHLVCRDRQPGTLGGRGARHRRRGVSRWL